MAHQDEDQLYDMLNLSPPPLVPEKPPGDSPVLASSINGPVYDYDGGHFGNNPEFHRLANVNLATDGVGSSHITHSRGHASQTGLLTPGNHAYNSSFLGTGVRPQSPSVYSTHSAYTDALLNPGSPYLDAVSQFSQAFLDNQNPPLGPYMAAPNTFDSEIVLGGSISSTNLATMQPYQYLRGSVPQLNVTEPLPQYSAQLINLHFLEVNRLTENNLLNYTLQQQQPDVPSHTFPVSYDTNGVTIQIQGAPEVAAAKTPSLFSNSSHNSLVRNSPRQAGNGNLVPTYRNGSHTSLQPLPTSPGSVVLDVSEHRLHLLNPDEFQLVRRGRRILHSQRVHLALRLRLRLHKRLSLYLDVDVEDDDFEDDYDENDIYDDAISDTGAESNKVSTREKMLELALPNQLSKRTQKHPLVYACHLCEKRFTRPYNLKLHLRTHTDERPFICNICGKAFARQHDRKRHEDLHTGEKKFQCKGILRSGEPYGCGRKFARADALRRHFQTEAGKECIRLLIEEDKRDGGRYLGGATNEGDILHRDLLSPDMLSSSSMQSVPQVAILPPD